MRVRRTWTGVFHCTTCQLEEELLEDESVECRECGERMLAGSLFEDDQERSAEGQA